ARKVGIGRTPTLLTSNTPGGFDGEGFFTGRNTGLAVVAHPDRTSKPNIGTVVRTREFIKDFAQPCY
ncbi:hypothetical protein OVW19_29760, partial [Klebsiella pneumoniae]|uniref:hypothetical protein n=1 Tax=Klebsiella pneumoniae TaxID=573 RepID=UPI002271AB2F